MCIKIHGPIYCLLGKHYNIWYVLILGLKYLKLSIKNVSYQFSVGPINRLVSEFIIINELLTKFGKM